MKLLQKKYGTYTIFILLVLAVFCPACKKDYYQDSGLQDGIYSISGLDFLKQRPFFFDSLVAVIHLAGMDEVIADSTITFFAPTDHAIAKAMDVLNEARHNDFEDSLVLEEVPQDVWKRFLSRYIFRGKYMLKDIARRDPSELNVYPGMNLESWNGYIMNLGVLYSNYEGTKDVGPRKVTITDIGDLASPVNITAEVATSDLQTKNSVIHVLNDSHEFGFSVLEFSNMVDEYLY